MSHKKYRGTYPYPTGVKDLATYEQVGQMLDELEKIIPLNREQLIRRAVQKYYATHIEQKANFPVGTLLVAQCHRCFYCKKLLTNKTSTIDHKTPLSRGGTNDRSNLVAACPSCNHEKSSMTAEEYVEFTGLSPLLPLTNTPLGVSLAT